MNVFILFGGSPKVTLGGSPNKENAFGGCPKVSFEESPNKVLFWGIPEGFIKETPA